MLDSAHNNSSDTKHMPTTVLIKSFENMLRRLAHPIRWTVKDEA